MFISWFEPRKKLQIRRQNEREVRVPWKRVRRGRLFALFKYKFQILRRTGNDK